MSNIEEKLEILNNSFAELSVVEALKTLEAGETEKTAKKISFSSSLGPEDQVITDAIFKQDLAINIFTLDTGRLFPESYDLLEETTKKYDKKIEVYYPKTKALQEYVTGNGINAIYDSVELRKTCCFIRKIEPLNRALKDIDIWVTGIRAEQSGYRAGMKHFEWDSERALIKFNPLLNWSTSDVWEYINKYSVPYNELHRKGFPSIGCQPCTRAIGLHEDERAGRWWWEDADKKECGLHGKSQAKRA